MKLWVVAIQILVINVFDLKYLPICHMRNEMQEKFYECKGLYKSRNFTSKLVCF